MAWGVDKKGFDDPVKRDQEVSGSNDPSVARCPAGGSTGEKKSRRKAGDGCEYEIEGGLTKACDGAAQKESCRGWPSARYSAQGYIRHVGP